MLMSLIAFVILLQGQFKVSINIVVTTKDLVVTKGFSKIFVILRKKN